MQPLRRRLIAAGVLAAIALLLYVTTLLPGQDLGDTASFQAIVGDHLLVPRQGYPLYFALNGALARLLPVEAARAANLGSAIAAAAAVGLVVLVGAELAGTLAAGLVAGLLLAGSYTFWSQAVIAEVYALHLLLASACLLALLAWKARPSTARLALFFALCALGFGNHLSMVLLLPGFALLLATAAPDGPRSMLRPRVVALAAAMAALFALQYAWNIRWLVAEHPNADVADLARTFWFDVTKTDWRANMVYGIPTSTLADRFAMYWFDVRQQFGLPGVAAAVVGFAALLRQQWRLGVMLLTLWFVNWVFAFTYNVGDVHVFYLGSHWATALAAGCGAGWAVSALQARPRRAAAILATLALLAYPAWRVWDTYPAMDRSDDREPTLALDRLVAGMDTGREVLGRDLNWQLHNGLDYYVKHTRRDLAVFDLPDTLLSFPFLVSRNAELGRTVLLTEGSAAMVRQLYGGLYDLERDPRAPVPTLAERVATLAPGTPYVLSIIEAYPEAPIDRADLAEAAKRLGTGDVPEGRFVIVAGRVGEPPVVRRGAWTPFRVAADLSGFALDVRIDCWMPADTIRRMGFGHVIVNRHHELTLDRGVSFVALDASGHASLRAWAAGLLAPQPRFVVRTRN